MIQLTYICMNQINLRYKILESIQSENRGDIGLSLAMADLIKALYSEVNYNSAKPQAAERDYVVLSDPGAWPALFECLKEAGFEMGEFSWRKYSEKTPGLEKTFLCPGYGLAVGLGVAQSLEMSKKPNNVYVLLSDDDLKAGTTWEAVMEASFKRMNNLVGIVSYNGTAKLGSVQDKFESFGWRVKKLLSGHNSDEISDAIYSVKNKERKPTVILAPTVLSKGVPFAEGKEEYRQAVFSETEMQEALKFLNSKT